MSNPFEKYLSSEDHTHRAILNYIKLQYPKAVVAHPANEGKRTPFEQFKIKWLGISAGLPDILIFTPGWEYPGLAIEVKSKTGRVSGDQAEWILKLIICGWHARVVRDFDTAKVIIDDYFRARKIAI